MSDSHPTCPKCAGLLKYEPADILGPERVECILCGWVKVRLATPVKPVPAPDKPAAMPRPPSPVEPRQKFGICPSCRRPDMHTIHNGVCGRCYYRQTHGIADDDTNHKPGVRAPRIATTATPAVALTNPANDRVEETTMAIKGTCSHCKRENVSMPSNGKCNRCYDRMKRGVDIFTGHPLPQKSPAAPVAPAILADDEPDTCLSTQKYVKSTQIHVLQHAAPPNVRQSASKAPLLRAHDFNSKKLLKRQHCDPVPGEIGYFTSPGFTVEVIARELFSEEEDLDLLAQLLALARGNRRTLQGEILFRLDKSLEAATNGV